MKSLIRLNALENRFTEGDKSLVRAFLPGTINHLRGKNPFKIQNSERGLICNFLDSHKCGKRNRGDDTASVFRKNNVYDKLRIDM